ncbi:MAG TPA: VanW family protein [Polyangiaceae bacterium]|jgi:vancomycin resistance protein YoaR
MSEPVGCDESARARKKKGLWFALGAVGACVLLLTGSFALSQRETGKIAHGVHIGEFDVSNLSRDEARAKMNAWIEAHANASIACTLAGSELAFVPKNAGFHGDDSVVERALVLGRQGSIPVRFAAFVARWFRPVVVPIAANFEAPKLDSMLNAWQSEKIKDHPFVGGISVSGTIVTPLYAHAGTVIDRERASAQLKESAQSGHGAAIATRLESPNEDRVEVDHIATLAASMLTSDIELGAPSGAQKLSLGAAEIAPLLQVKAETEHGKLALFCEPEAAEKLLEPRRAELAQAPQNAKFVIDAEDHVKVEPGHAGLTLDDTEVANAICAAAQDPAKKAVLPLRAGAEPVLSTAQAEALGIKSLMGTYTTRHACCQPRVENIHHIADLLDGTVVKPGDTFSVNQTIGPRTQKNGFRPAPSIEDGDMVDTVGGGVSQFATTLFNALFYGGYDIIERQPHTYWFTRYPMGYDATLSFPHPDIIFKNDTDAGALIKTSYTDKSITVKIYGDNGGRKVRAEVSPRQNIVEPPIEYIPNRHLDADEKKTREGGEIGWSVIVKRTLVFADGKTKEEKRKVTYKPRARRVEVHPCKIPEGELGHTGEKCPKPDPDKDGESVATDGSTK